MIKLGKRRSPPKSLNDKTVKDLKKAIAAKIKAGEKVKSEEFYPHWRKKDVRKDLLEIHHGKCCYCERKRDFQRELDVEHFRPKAGVHGVDHPGYWWLAYSWDNYFNSCMRCNRDFKKTHFPLKSEKMRAFGPDDDLNKEKPQLINPIDENPEDFIGYKWDNEEIVLSIGKDAEGRGKETIQILRLNRSSLLRERADIILNLKAMAKLMKIARSQNNVDMKDEGAAMIKAETSPKKTFAGFRRAYFRSLGLGEYIFD